MATPNRYPSLFNESFEDAFRRMLKPMRWELDQGPAEIAIDVAEDEHAYTVQAEMPGIKKEDIHIEIDRNVVTITGESKQQREEKSGGKQGQVLRSERYYGQLRRVFALGSEIDESKAEARCENGVLRLLLPKKAGNGARRLIVG